MQLDEFLKYALTSAGAGVITFAIVEFIDKLKTLATNFKFWLALGLAFGVPALAYGGQILLGLTVFSAEGVFLVAGVGYSVSQVVHKATEKPSGNQ